MSVATESTTWDRVVDLLSDGDWHTEEELEKVAHFPDYWIRELEESGYSLQRSANGHTQVRLLRQARD